MATLLEHWQPSTTSTLGMKNDVGLAKESCSVYADSFATDTEEVSGRGWQIILIKRYVVLAIIARGGNLML